MNKAETTKKVTAELSSAYLAEASGNLGRARVCARRAAGWAIGAFLAAEGGHPVIANALDNIKYYFTVPDIPEKHSEILGHLTLKVVKDTMEEDSYFPLKDVNLIAEAQWLAEQLLGVTLTPEKP